jgi:hypothetical protein
VRLCDGFFFPVNMSRRDARQDGDEICQSQCPATETRVYFMTSREIDRAVNTDGESYQSHANAFRYRKSFDPTCGCKRAGATWAETLRGAEDRMTSRSGDITVPGDGGGIAVIGGRPQPDELVLRGINSVGFNPDRPRAPPRETAPEQPTVEPLPGTVDIPKIEGETREVTGRDGVTRSVRVVSPPPAPVR